MGMRKGGWLFCTGGGEYSIHLISKGGDGRQWRPSIADRGGSRDQPPLKPLFCSNPGLSGPLRGCAHEPSLALLDLLGRVSLLRNSRQDKDIRLAGCALPRGGYKGGRWSPVATVHRRPRRQPRPCPPLKNLLYKKLFPLPLRSGSLPHKPYQREGAGGGNYWVKNSPSQRFALTAPSKRGPASLPEGAALRWRAFCADRTGR